MCKILGAEEDREELSKGTRRREEDFPMTLSPHSSVWTPYPLDQFMAKVRARDQKGSEPNHLICKCHNDCVSGTQRRTHASSQLQLKLSEKDSAQAANGKEWHKGQ